MKTLRALMLAGALAALAMAVDYPASAATPVLVPSLMNFGANGTVTPTVADCLDILAFGPGGTTATDTGEPCPTNVIFTLGTGTGACATSSTLVGGSAAGSFKCTGTAGASTQVVNLPTAPNGWSCWVNDTTSGVAGSELAAGGTASAAELKITIATTSDVVSFGCLPY